MSERSDNEFERIERALGDLFQRPRPDPAFTGELKQQLIARGSADTSARRESLRWHQQLRPAARAFALGSGIILMVLLLMWSINTLLPSPAAGRPELAPSSSLETPAGEGVSGVNSLALAKIAFQSKHNGNDEIYVMNGDGSDQTNLTNHPANDTAPSWSPDVQQIAFLSNRTGKIEIFLMAADGSEIVQLTNDPRLTWFAGSPLSWSPDGKRIAAAGSLDGGDENYAQLYLVETDGTDFRMLLESPAAQYPKWSPNGEILAFLGLQDGQFGLYTVNADGSDLERVLTGEDGGMNYSVFGGSFDWSPDGTQLAYLLQGGLTGSWPYLEFEAGARSLFKIADLESRSTRTVFEIPLPDGIRFASWSPDGETLMFVQDEANNGCWTIHLLPLDKQVAIDIPDLCYAIRTNPPDWSQDGQWLVYPAARDGSLRNAAIYALNVHGILQNPEDTVTIRLTEENGFDSNPQVSPVKNPILP